MPRVRQVSLSEAHPRAQEYYKSLFNGRDPVETPGTETGTPGHWWTTLALRPYVFDHAVAHLAMYGMFASESVSQLSARTRELALTRVGFAAGSQFVYSQHCKASVLVGIEQEKIDAIPHWNALDIWTPLERAVLAYTDAIVLDMGRVPDGVFAALKAEMSDEDIMELTYHIGGYVSHATFCRALRLEYDDVPERIVEVPMPGGADFRAWAARNGLDQKLAASKVE
jgi:alkylhydroperoxidase family enzyme